MKNKHNLRVSVPTLRRLPMYVSILKRLKEENHKYVSATTIARELDFEPIQVRKDLSITGIVGKPKVGFELEELIKSIGNFLNWKNNEKALIVGVGALGHAILGYDNFKNYGLNIVCAFDNDKRKIGKKFHGIKIYSMVSLSKMVKSKKISMAVITTPGKVAQEVYDLLTEAGIKAIWNFTPTSLKSKEGVIVESVHLSQSLAVLTHKMANLNS